jgi:hypothetical protein
MSPIKQQLLAAIEAAPDEVLAQTLHFLNLSKHPRYQNQQTRSILRISAS